MRHEWIYALILIPIVAFGFYEPGLLLIGLGVTIVACLIAAAGMAWIRRR